MYISPVCDFLFLIPFPLKNNDFDILFLWIFPRLNKSFNQHFPGLRNIILSFHTKISGTYRIHYGYIY